MRIIRKHFKAALCLLLCFATLGCTAFASASSENPAGTTGSEEGGIMLLTDLYTDTASSTRGRWESLKFTATYNYGCYIRYWHSNEKGHDVTVRLYRTDSGREEQVSSMTVPANSQKSQVYYSPSAETGTYRIVVDTTSADIYGQVAAAQYLSRP